MRFRLTEEIWKEGKGRPSNLSFHRYVPAIGCGIPVISSNHEEQINSEIEIPKGRSLIQDQDTSLGPATIYSEILF